MQRCECPCDLIAQAKAEGLLSYSPGEHPGERYTPTYAPCKGISPVSVIMPFQGADVLATFRPGALPRALRLKAFSLRLRYLVRTLVH